MEPAALQLLYFGQGLLDAHALQTVLSAHLSLSVTAELAPYSGPVNTGGPAFAQQGGVAWGPHTVKLLHSLEPMPYGPVESCVGPALLPPPMKVDAQQHGSHTLLYYTGAQVEALEQFAALCAVAGALARFDGLVVLNEEARTACPALDLIPEDGEDAMQTYRTLPIPYLLGGFVKMEVGDDPRPWVRTFANHRLGLPNLAVHLRSHADTGDAFHLMSGVLGYLRTMAETLNPGETIDLGEKTWLIRAPVDVEWWLDSDGPLLILEPAA